MKKYRPSVDKYYIIILVVVLVLTLMTTALASFNTWALAVAVPIDLFVLYFAVSPFFGYVSFEEDALYIKFGLFLSRRISYKSIRSVSSERKMSSDSMISLKCSLTHVNVKYNKYDVVSVSVVDNDELIREINSRIKST